MQDGGVTPRRVLSRSPRSRQLLLASKAREQSKKSRQGLACLDNIASGTPLILARDLSNNNMNTTFSFTHTIIARYTFGGKDATPAIC